ncbi:MAG: hypothetical protein FWE16_05880 [Firmicutes bacterium]|nr:hypothetical protein [Bacillota bacterium]
MEKKVNKEKETKELKMTPKEAMDVFLKHVSEGKKDIENGRVFTVEQAFATIQRK